MAVYIKGDIHGDFSELTDFIEEFNLNENDTIIVLGDMGLYWRKNGEDAKYMIDLYEKYYKTHILWIDGNHENFDLIEQLPIEPNTPFKRCSEHIHYIPRGTVFKINTSKGVKTCLACGGADSIDKFRRIKHLSWWEQEQITDNDIQTAIENVGDNHIDYIFSHCCPYSIFINNWFKLCTISGLDEDQINHTSEKQLDKLIDTVDFNKWYFGHYHIDLDINDKYTCVFENFIEL